MGKNTLITKQALKIEELESCLADANAALADANAALDSIHCTLVCIGGPLNDNKLGFTPKQLVLLREIDRLATYA